MQTNARDRLVKHTLDVLMPITQKSEKTKGRCLALFPGAFRPPHVGHYAAVLNLASRPDVDEVVVIITNRCRDVPGTTKVLDTDVAERLWQIYLRDVAKVRVEIAPQSAVMHALGYFDRVEPGDTLLFCIGETDLAKGASRFETLNDFAAQTGVLAKIIAAPTSCRATTLRGSLARGETGRAQFMAAIPAHVSPEQRENVWLICRQGMQDTSEIARQKVRSLLERAGFDPVEVSVAREGKRDEVFRTRLTDGRCYFVKYANDTVKAANLANPASLKPRQRLWVERRAIKWLRAHLPDDVELPEVVYFDKRTRTLVLSEVCPGGRSLEDDLKRGVFDTAIARRATRFMAQCHAAVGQVSPLGEDQETDLRHWRTMLALRTVDIGLEGLTDQAGRDLESLRRASDQARENRFVHLDYCPKNILLDGCKFGVIDLELSSNVGDPACDLGFLLGHYLLWGICTSSVGACQAAVREALSAYRQDIGDAWPSMQSRMVAFAGATILYRCAGNSGAEPNEFKETLPATALKLLSRGLGQVESADEMLCDAVAGRLV